ncbi:MAG: ABC transporter permease [Intrasporangium sp.]|uniref:ABC transporter permease n=1 Tax=Intrasporangium sp. TaxID=1925024 RepID=UPI0026489D87|nr:ABC transporter permease [Intrasporangium sp.]MDN5794410.1 ABC transporter permease [Intrasporangium sp.]
MTLTPDTSTPTKSPAPGPESAQHVDRAWQTVAAREIWVKLHDKNFLMSTFFTMVIIAAVFGVQAFFASKPHEATIAVTSRAGAAVVTQAEDAGAAADANLEWTTRTVADDSAALGLVRSGDADVALLAASDGDGWRLVSNRDKDDTVATWVGEAVTHHVLAEHAASLGTTVDQLKAGSAVNYDLLDTDAGSPGFVKAVGLIFAFLFYMAALIFGMQIAQSVVEEKQSRIVEILSAAIPIRHLLLGKIVGNVVMALTQLALFIGVGMVGLSLSPWSSMLGPIAGAAGWFLVFFLVGFAVLAALWAVAGSLATRHEDLQSTSTPVTTLTMVILFGGIFLTGTWQVIASYLPLMSVVAMPIRLASGTAAWWEPVLSIGITVALAAVLVRLAARIYSRSVMQTGSRLTLRQAMKLQG